MMDFKKLIKGPGEALHDEELTRLGFSWDCPKNIQGDEFTSHKDVYVRKVGENAPELRLEIYYPVHMCEPPSANVTITSLPQNEDYRFATGKAVPVTEIPGLVRSYLKRRGFLKDDETTGQKE
ncbi:MAG: hypothetical protein HY518_01770 [Candidatus Aenigmarchaeota archaeon]|nr:hypothetical protein [Candidatus Aenigmarchaeota archaeon]